MNLLKIAVVRPFFTLGKGGAERYTVELVRNLIGLGHQVHVYANSWDHPEDEKIAYHHVRMTRRPAWLRVLTFHR